MYKGKQVNFVIKIKMSDIWIRTLCTCCQYEILKIRWAIIVCTIHSLNHIPIVNTHDF